MQRLLLLVCLCWIGCTDSTPADTPTPSPVPKPSAISLIKQSFKHRIDSLLPAARQFTRNKGYNTRYCFIADLSQHSGFDRFAVVDLTSDSIVRSGLVAHGIGGKYFAPAAKFSNRPNSLCSSTGKYRIGEQYNGRFGKAYKLFGLDNTNSNAYERFIVLHAYDCVPERMTYPSFLCNSEGCPMVSYRFLDVLSGYIDKSRQPILLWILG